MLVYLYLAGDRVCLKKIFHSCYLLALSHVLNETGFLDLVVHGEVFYGEQLVEGCLCVFFKGSVHELLFPQVVSGIKGHRFECHTETKSALFVF